MRKNYLSKPNVTIKSFKVSNLGNLTDYAEGLFIDKTLNSSNVSAVYTQSLQLELLKMYRVNEKFYATCTDGYLYEKSGKEFIQKYKFGTNEPIMEKVILNGVYETLHMDETGGRILDKEEYAVDLPYGNHFATYSLRCFVSKERTVYFSSPFDFNSRSMLLDNCGNFNVSDEDGNVIGLYDFSKYLLIVCAKSLYKLTITDGEFSLEKINTDSYSIDEMSLAKIREKLLFISDGNFYEYENFTIKQITNPYTNKITKINYFATANEDFYFCHLTLPEKQCVFAYDVVKKQPFIVDVGESRLLCENMLSNYLEGGLYLIKKYPYAKCMWRSLPVNLGTNDKKWLLETSVKVTKNATLTIKGDFGSTTFDLKKGINKKTMNLSSKEFVFEIDCKVRDMIISDLQLKYMV